MGIKGDQVKGILSGLLILTALFYGGCQGASTGQPPGASENSSVTVSSPLPLPGEKSSPRPSPVVKQVKETQTGLASYLSESLQGVQTYSGETFDNKKPVAAHPSYPMGTIIRVTNLRNGREAEVRVIDRSASVKSQGGYIISLSRSAAEQLDFIRDGKVNVRTEVLEWGREP